MSSDWAQRTLDQLAVYHNGRAFKPNEWTKSGLPIVRIAQITNSSTEPNYYDGHDVDDKHLIDNGDLLFSWSATLAVLKWNNGPAILNQHIFKVVENDGIDRDFLYHLLHHALPKLTERSHGSTMRHIRKGVLREHLVSVPPPPEQRKIAAILSSVDDTIERAQATIDQAQVVKRGLMQELLARRMPGRHTRLTLDQLAVYHNGRAFKPNEWTKSGLPIVRIAQITNSGTEPNYYDGHDVDDKHLIDNGDLLFSWSATLAVTKWTNGPAILNQHIFKVMENDGIDRDFLYHLLHHALPKLAERSHGSTMRHIRKGVLCEHQVSVPPLSEQRKIAAILSSVDYTIEKTQAVIDQVQVVKCGLMQELFTQGVPRRRTRFKQIPIGEVPK